MRWDIFCRVVDNYGDAGVAWRLARILASEHALDVTLWIDALAPLARIAPDVDAVRAVQRVDGVTVRNWVDRMPVAAPADVVVEMFAAGLPERYVEAMAGQAHPPRWIRLEHLALEPGFDTHHRLPSPHPRLPLARAFWFPGFSARTGGLLRERELFAERDAFVANPHDIGAFCSSLGVPARRPNELRISMFCYPHAPLDALVAAWRTRASPTTCIVPHGVARDALARIGIQPPADSSTTTFDLDQATIVSVPFVAQPAYDRLLWSCDVNFVRGEDSFVRAQWAAKPFVWNAYPQADDAHAAKIAAFVDRYTAALDAHEADAVRAMFSAWNGLRGAPPLDVAWRAYESRIDTLQGLATRWSASLADLSELASALVESVGNAL